MGSGSIPTRANGTAIDQLWFNSIQQALGADVFPRDTGGNVADVPGSLGSSTYRWLKAFIASGYWTLGDYKYHNTYNGAAPVDQGWMLCDGRQITQANYDTEHGAGSWATYIGTSPLLNKYLPGGAGKYLVGSATTPQDGTAPITTVGNAGNVANLSHSHTVNSHTHDMGNHTHTLPNGTIIGVGAGALDPTTGGPSTNLTGATSPGTDSQLGTANIQPESIQAQLYMRII